MTIKISSTCLAVRPEFPCRPRKLTRIPKNDVEVFQAIALSKSDARVEKRQLDQFEWEQKMHP